MVRIESAATAKSDERLPPERPVVDRPLGYMVQLDGLRAVAVASVMLFHFTLNSTGGDGATAHALDEGWLIFAHMGVTLFFVLSGFLITGILLKCREDVYSGRSSVARSLRQFYMRRFLRIFPAFYLVIFIAFVFAQAHSRGALAWHAAYLSNFYFAKSGVMLGPLSHLWSLSVEEQFYLAWPLIVLLTPRRWLISTLILMIVAAMAYRAIAVSIGLNAVAVGALPIACLDALGLGSLLAVSSVRGTQTLRTLGLWVGLPLWLALIAVHLTSPMPRTELIVSRTIVALFSTWLVAGAASRFKGPFRWLLEMRPVVYVGTISYGLYLYHNLMIRPVGLMAERMGLVMNGGILSVTILILATLLTATLSWFFLERPINARKRRFPYLSAP